MEKKYSGGVGMIIGICALAQRLAGWESKPLAIALVGVAGVFAILLGIGAVKDILAWRRPSAKAAIILTGRQASTSGRRHIVVVTVLSFGAIVFIVSVSLFALSSSDAPEYSGPARFVLRFFSGLHGDSGYGPKDVQFFDIGVTIVNQSAPTAFYDWKMAIVTADGTRHEGRYRRIAAGTALCILNAGGNFTRCGPEKALDLVAARIIPTAEPVDAAAEFEFPDIPPSVVNPTWSKKCHVELSATAAIDGLRATSWTLLSEIDRRGPQILHGCDFMPPPCLRQREY